MPLDVLVQDILGGVALAAHLAEPAVGLLRRVIAVANIMIIYMLIFLPRSFCFVIFPPNPFQLFSLQNYFLKEQPEAHF
jgi:hypothetical protein